MCQCKLLTELRKLKESSKEAVEGIDLFTDFKKYIHVERNVEKELMTQLSKIKENGIKKQLVLVCGSVGDGKSHVISYIKNNGSKLLDGFIIHNDATESNDPNKSYLEILDELFKPFSDERIDFNEEYKIIVAINLGTLSNFIESQNHKHEYDTLKKFVYDNKIIEDEIVEHSISQFITYVSFSDYSIFEITDKGPQSEFIEEILNRLILNDDKNKFYQIYNDECSKQCEFNSWCCVKYNYELIFEKIIRKEISNIIIESIIKHKVILSVRGLFDFIYNLIVPNKFEEYSNNSKLNDLYNQNYNHNNYVEAILPNLLYEQNKISPLYSAIYYEDPLNDRLESIDQIIINVNVSRDVTGLMKEYFNEPQFEKLHEVSLSNWMDDSNRDLLLKTYLRYARLFRHEAVMNNDVYHKYMQYLYSYNTKKIIEYKNLYEEVIESIYIWNGYNEKPWINIKTRENNSEYNLSHELKIEPYVDIRIQNSNNDKCYKFINEIKIELKDKPETGHVTFAVDFDLYSLITKVRKGYRLNYHDKENYISFIESIKKIMSYGEMKDTIRITHKKNKHNFDYILKKDSFGGYIFEPFSQL